MLKYVDTFTAFSSKNEIFDTSRDKSNLAEIYSSYIAYELAQHPETKGFIGALIIEPGKHFTLEFFSSFVT